MADAHVPTVRPPVFTLACTSHPVRTNLSVMVGTSLHLRETEQEGIMRWKSICGFKRTYSLRVAEMSTSDLAAKY